MSTPCRAIRVAICSSVGLALACERAVRVTYYCPDHRTFLVTTSDSGAQVSLDEATHELAPVGPDSGARYSDGVRQLAITGTEATLTLSDSVALAGCTSAPHP